MSDEGKKDVESPEADEIQPDPKTGKIPESIPSSKYIGVKEAYGRAKEKVASLEEKLKNAPSKEAYDKAVKDLADANAKIKDFTDKESKATEKTATELREALKGKGVTDEQLKDMSVAEMQRLQSVLGGKKPALPDFSGGGTGGGVLKGSPSELAVRAYESSNKPKK